MNRSTFIFILAVWIGCAYQGFAQALTNNNALITVSTSTRMTVLGGALNNGDLSNNGTVSISGDWMNVDTYTPGSGILILNGTDQQRINHNGGQVFKLYVDGGGEKIFNSSMELQDSLVFNDGIVTISDGVSLLVQPNGAVAGGSDQSYVAGPLFHQGTGYKYFPTGSDGRFRPAELLNVTGSNPVVGISVHQPNTDPIIPLQLLSVSDTRYWSVSNPSGVFDGSTIRLKVGSDEALSSEVEVQDIVVSRSDSVGGMFLSLGQSIYSGTQVDGEVTSTDPIINGILAIAVEGFAEERSLYVPNALSPAAPDPEDQVAKVYGQQIVDEGFSFRIYNRWGLLVYETSSFTEANSVGWNGEAANGDDEAIGVYTYTLVGRFASGKPFSRQGTIKIIR